MESLRFLGWTLDFDGNGVRRPAGPGGSWSVVVASAAGRYAISGSFALQIGGTVLECAFSSIPLKKTGGSWVPSGGSLSRLAMWRSGESHNANGKPFFRVRFGGAIAASDQDEIPFTWRDSDGAVILRFDGFLFHPVAIHFNEAIGVATLGLLVNIASTLLLKEQGHSHGHDHHDHSHPHTHGHDDLNLKAAYIHVLADAVTSVLAITALIIGKFSGWTWLDPVIGIVGSAVIAQWAYSLIQQTNIILLDREPDSSDLNLEIRKALEQDETRIADLHIWQVGVNKFAAIISLVTHHPQAPVFYKERLKEHEELVHVTVEVNECGAR